MSAARIDEERQNAELQSYRDNIGHLMLSLHTLASQKAVLSKMLENNERAGKHARRHWQGFIDKAV